MSKFIKNFYLPLLALIVLGTVVKVWFINTTGIGSDESYSLYMSQGSITQIISALNMGDNPPFWEIILHYWNFIFGVNLLSARSLSLIFNVLTIIPIWLLGERYIAKNVGSIASLLYIFSSFSLFMAHEARVYSLLGFLVCTSSLLFLKAIQSPPKFKYHLLLAILNALIFYSHYLGVWIIIAQLLSLFILPHFRKTISKFTIYQYLLLAFFCAPQLPTVLQRLSTSGSHGTWVEKSGGVADIYYMLLRFSNAPVIAVTFILLAISAMFFAYRRSSNFAIISYLSLWLWFSLILSFLLSFKTGFFLDRYFYFTSPALYLLVASGVTLAFSKSQIITNFSYFLLTIGMLLSCKYNSANMRYSGYHKDVRPLVSLIKKHKTQPNSAIIVTPEWFMKDLVYYYDYPLFTTYFDAYMEQAKFVRPMAARHIYATSQKLATNVLDSINKLMIIDENQSNVAITNTVLASLEDKFLLDTSYTLHTRKISFYTKK